MTTQYAMLMIMVALLGSCSRPVLRQSQSEIERPLFLPPRNWQGWYGSGISHWLETTFRLPSDHQSFGEASKSRWYPLFDLRWPPIVLSQKVELYIPGAVRVYLLKNLTEDDGVIRATGMNCALLNGIVDVSFSGSQGPRLTTHHSLLVKKPLSDRVWTEGSPAFGFRLAIGRRFDEDFRLTWNVPASLGCQITERFSIKGSIILAGRHEYYVLDTLGSRFRAGWLYTRKTFDLNLLTPMEFGYVFNRSWEFRARTGCWIYDTRNVRVFGEIAVINTW